MTDDRTLRAYLLGELSADDRAALEMKYLAQSELVDRLSDAEDDLVDAYLTHRLTDEERVQFDRSYLASPGHRTRVAVARRLKAAAEDNAQECRRWSITTAQLAVAATVVLMVSASVWWLRSAAPSPQERPAPPNAGTTAPANPSIVRPATTFAISVAPINVRGAADRAAVSIPPGTDVVVLNLEADAAEPPSTQPHVVLRTVEGTEVWRGAATSSGVSPPTVARAEIPAARLAPGDYIAELTDTRFQYFLRVRR